VISNLRQSTSTWRLGGEPARITRLRRRPVGTAISFTLDQPATVTLRFSRTGPGQRGRADELRMSADAGSNRLRFQGRLSRRRVLRAGRYALLLMAVNTNGQRATAGPLHFTIVK
jgi:hypothetical protein